MHAYASIESTANTVLKYSSVAIPRTSTSIIPIIAETSYT